MVGVVFPENGEPGEGWGRPYMYLSRDFCSQDRDKMARSHL